MTIVHFRVGGPAPRLPRRPRAIRLTEAELAPLRGADIVLAAAGGPPTIDFPEIPALLDAIGPRIVMPMHYKTPRINLNIQPLERFLEVPARRPRRSAAGRSCDRGRRAADAARADADDRRASNTLDGDRPTSALTSSRKRRDHVEPDGPEGAGRGRRRRPWRGSSTGRRP